jgi:hypothetical protein
MSLELHMSAGLVQKAIACNRASKQRMKTSRPPGKRTSFPNPLMIFIIIGIIIVGVAAFLVLRPNPSGKPANSTASPASQH